MTGHEEYPHELPYFDCLNKGFVALVDVMGDDAAIVQAARVSYGKGTKSQREDKGLISYLLRNRHTSPFEMAEMKFLCRMPMFVARQWIRHRTANVNEYSGRYSEMKDLFFEPHIGSIAPQSDTNKQGRKEEPVKELVDRVIAHLEEDSRTGDLSNMMAELERVNEIEPLPTQQEWRRRAIAYKYSRDCWDFQQGIRGKVAHMNRTAYWEYKSMLEQGVARELARVVLPLTTYTEWYWKIDLHNLMHFLRLRLDSHAQAEIRVYAEAIALFVQRQFPLTWEVFQEMNDGCFLTGPERQAIVEFVQGADSTHHGETGADEMSRRLKDSGFSDRRLTEFRKKMGLS